MRAGSSRHCRPERSQGPAFSAAFLLLAVLLPLAAGEEQGIIAAVERRYNRAQTLQADFIQQHTWGRTTRVESGRVFFRKPGQMRWEYAAPDEKLFLTDGDYAYLYVPAEAQVRRTPLKQTPEWQAAFALLVERVSLRRLFGDVGVTRIERPDSAARWQLRLRPRSAEQGFREVWLDLDADARLLRVEIRQPDGGLMEFHFRRWQENPPLSPDLFRISVPPGTAWLTEPAR